MNIATQEQLDVFMKWALVDPEIYPYLSTSKYTAKKEISKDDWEKIIFISGSGNTLLTVKIDRIRDIEFHISLYSKNAYSAGEAIKTVESLIVR